MLAFVAPLNFMLKVRKWTVISPAKNYQNSLSLYTTKETALAPFNLSHPIGGANKFPYDY